MVTVNVPGAPIGKVVAAALVIAGAWVTVSVKVCVAGVAVPPLSAVNVSGYAAAGAGGRACRRASPVPSPLSVKVTPAGSAPLDGSRGHRRCRRW